MASKADKTDTEQFLTFYLDRETFALNVLQIKEIISYSKVTEVPLTIPEVLGVINIRGSVIPVVDLGVRLGIRDNCNITDRTSIIIVENREDDEIFEVGLVVDLVNEVYDISLKKMEDAPDFGSKVSRRFMLYVGNIGSEFITILNHKTILDAQELSEIAQKE